MRTRLKSYLKAATFVDVLPLHTVVASPFPLREDLGHIEELIQSVKRRGILEPIIVRPKASKFEIVAGHRRFAACRANKYNEIPAIVVDLSDKDAFEISLEENIQRKSLDTIEEATAFKFYVKKYGYGGVTDLAGRIGKSQEYVSHRIALLNLPRDVQDLVRRRLLSSSDAWELARMKDSEAQLELADAALEQKLSVKQLRRAANLLNEGISVGDVLSQFNGSRSDSSAAKTESRETKVRKNVLTIMRATVIRLDNTISQLEKSGALKEDIMRLRVSLHELIDAFLNGEGDDNKSIEEVSSFIKKEFLKSLNVKDLDKFVTSRVPEYSWFDDFPPLVLMNLKRSKKHLGQVFDTIDYSNCRVQKLRVSASRDMALATFLFRYDLIVGGYPYRAKARISLVFLRSENGWKILHEHWSPASYQKCSIERIRELQRRYDHIELDSPSTRMAHPSKH